jgi:phospholipase/carboxylesterase
VQYDEQQSPDAITLTPRVAPRGVVIWLHGLGADGSDFVPAVRELGVPEHCPLRFIFPHAAPRPVSLNNGYIMRAWYDIRTLTGRDEDEAGIKESEQVIQGLIDAERKRGIEPHRIVLAGFSQGGAMTLYAGLRYPERLAGLLALSTYLPLADRLAVEAHAANQLTPILMCHGLHDDVVPLQAGERSRDMLASLGYSVRWQTYAMQHEVAREELVLIGQWLAERMR